ncbi:MAG: hypothetical protein BMS9Abin29_1732 [Gemmatimonadota bacterium]|nr:MAG: hypothetical protein BMS9Abin29_1732 [Gemmatimonadota bacterium]
MTQSGPTFFEELKRRKVVRVAMVYGAAAFAVLEGADMVFPRLGLPDWTVTFVMMLAIVGFPIALVLSWAFDITPEGVERTGAAVEGATPTAGWPVGALLAGVLVGAGAAGVTLVVLGGATVRTVSTEGVTDELLNTVAVLPFTTIGTDQASLDFAAGLHGDLTTQLTKVRSLRVTSQTSMVRYAGTDKTIPVIAQELGVLVILEGVVQRAGDQVRIQAQLIDGRTDEHLWADTYDREFTVANVFAIQSDIASTIAAALKATLTDEEQSTIEAAPTESPAAYAAYLAAMARWPFRLTDEEARAIAAHLEDAVSIDPNFGLAWARLAEARGWLVFFNLAGPDAWARALAAEAEAIRLAPGAPETQMAQGILAYQGTRDYARAEQHFSAVRRDRPGNAEAVFWSGVIQKRQGHYPAAAGLYQQAARLDPMSPAVWTELAVVNRALGLFSQAARFAEQAMSVTDGRVGVNHRFASLILSGDTAAARTHWSKNSEAVEESFYWGIFLDHYLKREMGAVADSLDRRRPANGLDFLVNGDPVTVARVNWLAGRDVRVAVLSDSIKTQARETLSTLEGQGLPLLQAGVLSRLAQAEALLGNSAATDDAIQRALELTDGVDMNIHEAYRLQEARIYLILGDADAAVESLESYLQRTFEYLSPALLRLDPFWDRLRDNPRFQALLELEKPGPMGP